MDDSNCRSFLRFSLSFLSVLLLTIPLLAQVGAVTDEFELGDSIQPEVPGTGDIISVSNVPGPDWHEIFNADGSLRDEFGPGGVQPGNGIPDFIDLYGGIDALFIGDDISAGSSTDLTVRHNGGRLQTGFVEGVEDLSNAYVYLTKDAGGNLLLYAGLERLGTGVGTVELEFNQGLFRVGRGWPDTIGWEIVGTRTAKDLRLTFTYPDGNTASLTSVAIDSWEDPESDGSFTWIRKETLTAEGCNAGDAQSVPPIAPDTLCAFVNQSIIEGGDWPSYDATGSTVASIGPDCFSEVGINVGSLLEIVNPSYGFTTAQLRTADDLAFGYFGEGN